jgi:hypothetical protein
MLLRISLIVAIVAAIAIAVLNFTMVKDKIETTERHRAEEQAGKETAMKEAADNKREWDKTAADLKTTQETLATTTQERDRAVAETTTLNRKVTDLTGRLTEATTQRDDAQAQLAAYKATGYNPPQILAFDKQFKDYKDNIETLTVENKTLVRKVARIQNQLDELIVKDWRPPPLPAELRGKVLVSDPKWDFVIVDVGEDQGVFEKGEMLVSRNGKLVAKLSVRSVEKNRCIANVLPGWKIGDVMEGDQILPAS